MSAPINEVPATTAVVDEIATTVPTTEPVAESTPAAPVVAAEEPVVLGKPIEETTPSVEAAKIEETPVAPTEVSCLSSLSRRDEVKTKRGARAGKGARICFVDRTLDVDSLDILSPLFGYNIVQATVETSKDVEVRQLISSSSLLVCGRNLPTLVPSFSHTHFSDSIIYD